MEASDWIALGSGVVAVAAAIIAGWQAHIARNAADKQMKLSERIHREQNEPYVVVDVGPMETGSSLLVLSIHNSGPTMARDVKVKFTPELTSSDTRLTQRLERALSRPIAVLPPGRRIFYAVDTFQRWKSDLPMEFEVEVDATGPAGPVEQLTYRIDLEVLAESLIGERPAKRVEDALGTIADNVKDLASAYGRANAEAIQAAEQRRWDNLRRQAEED